MTTEEPKRNKKDMAEQKPYINEDSTAHLQEPAIGYQHEAAELLDEEVEDYLDQMPFKRIPGLPYTHEERMAQLMEDLEALDRGEDDSITMEELEEEMKGW